jgi:hypothetical protein
MRNLSVGSASFSSYKYTAFWGKQCKSLFFFYELRGEREVRWREKGGESMEISNLKRNRLGVFRVVFTSQRVHIVESLYLGYT